MTSIPRAISFSSSTPETVVSAGSGGAGTGVTASRGDHNHPGTNLVAGPASVVDDEIARWDGTGGKTLQGYTSGGPTVGDTGTVDIGLLRVATGGAANALVTQRTTNTQDVQTKTEISPAVDQGGMAIVNGRQVSASANRFCDVVLYGRRNDGIVVIGAMNTNGSPDARTYSSNSSAGNLELAMATNDYDICVQAFEFPIPT